MALLLIKPSCCPAVLGATAKSAARVRVGPHVRLAHARATLVRRSSTSYAKELLPLNSVRQPAGGGSFNISSYDADPEVTSAPHYHPLSENKTKLNRAFAKCQVMESRKALMLAMAMQESTHMDARARDATKDYDGAQLSKSANATIFNLSVDLIEQIKGYNLGDDQFKQLCEDNDDALCLAVDILQRAFEKWGTENTLAFVRQGRSGYDPKSKKSWRDYVGGNKEVKDHVEEYLDSIKTYLQYIDDHPELFSDRHRPDIPTPHI